ncbi:hypothetical protein FHU13_005546 [Methylobacterium sp. R2-1]|nr:hypothetical protein [Methylobacterium sp. R2-1]
MGRCHSELTGEGCWIDNPCAVWVAFKSQGVPSFSLDSSGGLRRTVSHLGGGREKTYCAANAAAPPGDPGTPKPIRVVGAPAFLAPGSENPAAGPRPTSIGDRRTWPASPLSHRVSAPWTRAQPGRRRRRQIPSC